MEMDLNQLKFKLIFGYFIPITLSVVLVALSTYTSSILSTITRLEEHVTQMSILQQQWQEELSILTPFLGGSELLYQIAARGDFSSRLK